MLTFLKGAGWVLAVNLRILEKYFEGQDFENAAAQIRLVSLFSNLPIQQAERI